MSLEPVDIVLCTYNGEAFLAQQLDSILNQTYSNFRILIFDDCSIDNTAKIIKNFQNHTNKICWFRNNTRLGLVKNYEQGIAYASAPYIALADQDDIWDEKKLEIQMQAMLARSDPSRPCLIHSDLQVINDSGQLIATSYFKRRKYTLSNKNRFLPQILSYNGVMGCTILINEPLKKAAIPFPTKTHLHDYWLAVLNECIGERITLNTGLVKYRIHQSNTSQAGKRIFKEAFSRGPSTLLSLPYIKLANAPLFDHLLKQSDISNKDKLIIQRFEHYLNGDINPMRIMGYLFRHRYFKINIKLIYIFIGLWKRHYACKGKNSKEPFVAIK